MGALMGTFFKKRKIMSLQPCRMVTMGVTTMSLQRHYKAAETTFSTKVGIPTLLLSSTLRLIFVKCSRKRPRDRVEVSR